MWHAANAGRQMDRDCHIFAKVITSTPLIVGREPERSLSTLWSSYVDIARPLPSSDIYSQMGKNNAAGRERERERRKRGIYPASRLPSFSRNWSDYNHACMRERTNERTRARGREDIGAIARLLS